MAAEMARVKAAAEEEVVNLRKKVTELKDKGAGVISPTSQSTEVETVRKQMESEWRETSEATEAELEVAQEALQEAQTEMETARAELEASKEEIAEGEEYRDMLEENEKEMTAQVETLEEQVTELQAQIAELDGDGMAVQVLPNSTGAPNM